MFEKKKLSGLVFGYVTGQNQLIPTNSHALGVSLTPAG